MVSGRLPLHLVILFQCLLVQNAAPSDPCSSRGKANCPVSDPCYSHTCPYGSDCVANSSRYTCRCKRGFRLCMTANNCTIGRPYCKDIDECKGTSVRCDSRENCLNTIGSYCCLSGGSRDHCTNCERSCLTNAGQNGQRPVDPDHVCISACEIQTLYQSMSTVNRGSPQFENIVQLLDETESMMMSLVEAPSSQREERMSMDAFGRLPTAALVVHKDLDEFLCNETKPGHEEVKLSSKVITMVIGNMKNSFVTEPLVLTFFHNKSNKDNFNITCVYWDHTTKDLHWSSQGCELVGYNSSHTTCKAHHLSSFAILMALKVLPEVFELQLITYFGLSISLLCLFLAIVTFCTCQPQMETRGRIHINLCISLFLADFIFLLGISQTSNQILCGVIAAVLHYLFLAVFVWMLLEGVQLYLMVEVVFATKVPLERYIYWIGYGLPVVVVGISAGVYHRGYGTTSACWLTTQNHFSCSFFVPAIFICLVNLIILCKTLVKLLHVISDQKNLRKNRVFTLTAIGQLAILGCTWIFGGLFIENATIPMMYIFTILNSFQGLFIFVMHCLMWKKVREFYRRSFKKCFHQSFKWTPISTSSSNQMRSVQETESTSGAVH
ncbi:adhesion G protein-coupled receptor E5-like isoform X1 [Narcine bancroftii]|uniref:adhesion G protein-coupled receptor E5-like isoform X1 n=1 Tax=Narcine bancroftii TaxID=1343680 RepID=UPI003831F72F